jgi:hypothetical protein
MSIGDTFVNCEKCGKRLIMKKADGVWYFCFGKSDEKLISPVELYVCGAIKIKCTRKNCNHWNEPPVLPITEAPLSR